MHLMKIVFVEDSIAAWSVVPREVPATEHPLANPSILIGSDYQNWILKWLFHF